MLNLKKEHSKPYMARRVFGKLRNLFSERWKLLEGFDRLCLSFFADDLGGGNLKPIFNFKMYKAWRMTSIYT